MRLIDADEVYKILTEYYHHRTDMQHIALKDALDRVPTIDAVEVVRCKDCKHRLHLQATSCRPEQYLCRLDDRTFFPSRRAYDPEWFCADGEKNKGGYYGKNNRD